MNESTQEQKLHTYVRRRGRITSAQQRGYDYAKSGLAYQEQELLTQIKSEAPIGVEIGFGMGHALAHWAEEAPEWLLVGIELYQPGIGSLAQMAERAALKNLRIVEQSAQEFCATLPDHCLHEVRIYFPDPWPKKRHFKRRLIQVEFVRELHRVLVPGGIARLASDWAPYAQWMRDCFLEVPEFAKLTDTIRDAQDSVEAPPTDEHQNEDDAQVRPVTKFERRGERLGHAIHDLIYTAKP